MNSVAQAQDLLERYGNLEGEALLSPLIRDVFPGRLCLVSSFGAEAALLLHMVSGIDSGLPVVFLDTQKLFPETLAYRDLLVERLGLSNIRTIYPDYTDTSRSDPDGTLWQSNPNACCTIRKVKPLQKALKGFDAWITGRKRYHGGMRTALPLIEASEGRVKINPLASWSAQDIKREFERRGLPAHPLRAQGYFSIGCLPCTAPPASEDDVRSGRWQGREKQECGIHLGDDGKFYKGSQ
ncbi:MAG: phosphoadenylyl-sulfate reductase [Alphaproteobacteria bacterium]|nr:phosphoadenylyl-sulfate reductase [Alphaproteobacteria bacterium]